MNPTGGDHGRHHQARASPSVHIHRRQQAFVVIREAIRKEGMVALGKVVFTSREHIIALEARDKGMMGITLRYPYEVRDQNEYFDDIENEKVPKDMLDLAIHIVETKKGTFKPDKFEDQYEDVREQMHRFMDDIAPAFGGATGETAAAAE